MTRNHADNMRFRLYQVSAYGRGCLRIFARSEGQAERVARRIWGQEWRGNADFQGPVLVRNCAGFIPERARRR